MDGMLPNFFTLNGKSFPATETVKAKRGQRVLFRLIGAGAFTHPMHLHGTDFEVIAKDGHPLGSPFKADVIQIGSGERYDIAFAPNRPGKWIFHCHIGHHLTNDGDAPGGLLTVVEVI
jgi:FtsP/CotA-like multicopper oxidase with cupredoxin domain